MKIKYDAPCPPMNGLSKGLKYEEQYNQIFYFAHSDDKEIIFEVDKPKSFICSVWKTYQYIYPKFSANILDGKVRLKKTW